jgi:hypothetical protein
MSSYWLLRRRYDHAICTRRYSTAPHQGRVRNRRASRLDRALADRHRVYSLKSLRSMFTSTAEPGHSHAIVVSSAPPSAANTEPVSLNTRNGLQIWVLGIRQPTCYRGIDTEAKHARSECRPQYQKKRLGPCQVRPVPMSVGDILQQRVHLGAVSFSASHRLSQHPPARRAGPQQTRAALCTSEAPSSVGPWSDPAICQRPQRGSASAHEAPARP